MIKEKLVKEKDKMYFNNTYHPTIPSMPNKKLKPPRTVSAERGNKNYEALKSIEKELHNILLELKRF